MKDQQKLHGKHPSNATGAQFKRILRGGRLPTVGVDLARQALAAHRKAGAQAEKKPCPSKASRAKTVRGY